MNAPLHNRQKLVDAIVNSVAGLLLGKDHEIRLALACLLSRGHLLIEDLPGMGKTTLAHALAAVLGLSYSRIQFTSDLLPADIVGVSVFDRTTGGFQFHPGPVFSQLVLADEINRTTPKTQSALLEAMAEGQVTVENETRMLPQPFFVIATQNPVHSTGTFPLPESQLDRFMMRIRIGYPEPLAEREMLLGGDPRLRLAQLKPCVREEQLDKLQRAVTGVQASEAVVDYLQRLVQYTRTDSQFELGLSPRGALAILQAGRAWAMMDARHYVIPEDIQAVFPAVAGHRLQGAADAVPRGDALVEQVLNAVDIV